MQKTKNSGFAGNALLLCLGGIICKIIGAFYKIPLTNVLGAEGIGLYQTVFPVFAIILTLSSGGISQSVSALISAHERDFERSILRGAILVVSMGVFLLSFALYALSPAICKLQGVSGLRECYLVLIPAVVFSGYSCILRGYYQAKKKFSPTIVSQIIEQGAKLILGISLSLYLAPQGVIYAVTGALIGVSLSEFLSFLYLFIRYFVKREGQSIDAVTAPFSFSFLRVLRMAIPLSIGGIITPLSNLVDSVSVINLLSPVIGQSLATAEYGILSGTVSTLTNLPAVFTLSLGVAVLPHISQERERSTIHSLREKAQSCVKLTLFICIPVSVFMIACAPFIISFLYPSLNAIEHKLAVDLLAISALSVTPLGITQIYSSLFFGIGLSSKPLKNLVLSVGVKCALLLPAIRLFGIYGVAVVNVSCYITSASLNARSFQKTVRNDPCFEQGVRASVVSVLLAILLFWLIPYLNYISIFALCGLCVVLYLYITTPLVFTKAEINSLPFIKTRKSLKGERDAHYNRSWKQSETNHPRSAGEDQ